MNGRVGRMDNRADFVIIGVSDYNRSILFMGRSIVQQLGEIE